ncbi:MAG: hypothetical protein KJN95_01090 [Gammaproteobacteria bacterium]|nr:hypothetical protein [Gammaproteobacteria bacterium]MBT8436710.1 hypothetical protein [Gammaproteobacteria bacterium]
MKQFKTLLTQLLVITSLMLPWATTAALETFEKAGHITSIGYDTFTMRDQKYRISPSAQLKSNDASRNKFSDFKKGDEIYFKGKILNGVFYVDIIFYEKPDLS